MSTHDSTSQLHRTIVLALVGGATLLLVIALWWFYQQSILITAYQQWLGDSQAAVNHLVATSAGRDSSAPSPSSDTPSSQDSLATLNQQVAKLRSFSAHQIPFLAPDPTTLPAFAAFQATLGKLTASTQALAKQERDLLDRQQQAGQWFSALQAVATQLTALQNQPGASSPSASLLDQHKAFLLSLPRQLDGASATTLASDAHSIEQLLAQVPAPTRPDPSLQAYRASWLHLADLLQAVATLPTLTQSITSRRLELRQATLSVGSQLTTLGQALQGRSLPLGFFLLGTAVVLLLLAALLFAKYSTDWARQSTRGRVANDRFEMLEVDTKDIVRQMHGLYRDDTLKLQVFLEPLDNRASLLVPVVKIFNQVLLTVNRLCGQIEQGLSEINRSAPASASAQQVITAFSQRHRLALQALQKSLNQVKTSNLELAATSDRLGGLLTPHPANLQGCHDLVQSLKLLGEDLRQDAFSATKQTKKLGESTQTLDLSEFVQLSSRLQVVATNILLEAIPLGEKGKRFNLFAHEIQQLGNSLLQATRQSEVVLTKVQEDIHVLSANAESSAAGVARSNAQLSSLGEDLGRLLADALAMTEQFQFVHGSLVKLSTEVTASATLQEANNEESETFHHQVIVLADNLNKTQQVVGALRQSLPSNAQPPAQAP